MSNIAIIAPSPIEGSGGVARIYTYAKALDSNGHQCDVYVFDCGRRNANDLSKDANNYYAIDGIHIIPGLNLKNNYELLIATRWDTAKIVRDMPAQKKAYLVQDFEACFNPLGDGTILAENSYLYGLQTITYGRWLALKLYNEFGNTPYFCNFATDLDTFRVKHPMRDRLKKSPAVCFIYQNDKPRRCPHLGIETLGIVKHMRPDVEIYFVGSNKTPDLWYDYTNVGLLSKEKLNDLYNRCHIGFCLSSSNPSCNLFDMMAAGLPSVDLYRENNLFDIPSGGVLLAHQTPESLAEAILYLISNTETHLKMSDFGMNFMKSRSTTIEINEFLAAINSILSGKPNSFNITELVRQRYTDPAVIAGVYKNHSVGQHVCSQLNKNIFLVNESVINDKNESTLKLNRSVSDLGKAYFSTPPINKTFMSMLKRFIKRLLGKKRMWIP